MPFHIRIYSLFEYMRIYANIEYMRILCDAATMLSSVKSIAFETTTATTTGINNDEID